MTQIDEKRIKKAIKEGKLLEWDKIFASYPKSRQKRIREGARHIMAAMEVRRLRKSLKLSQAELAHKMDVKREFVSRIEGGEQNITLDTLYKIAEATGRQVHLSFK